MIPTPTPTAIPAIVAVAPVVVPASQWLQIVIGGATALAAMTTVVMQIVNSLKLQTIHVSFNSAWHELLAKTESLALQQGASTERERVKAAEAEEHGK